MSAVTPLRSLPREKPVPKRESDQKPNEMQTGTAAEG